MRYGFFTLLGALGFGLVAVSGEPWQWVLLWPAASFLWFTAGYFGLGPGILFKRPDGSLPGWSMLITGPFLWGTYLTWYAGRWLGTEDPHNRIDERLWLGRRPLAHDLPEEVDLIVDLTAEFPLARGLPGGRQYRCLPTLDGTPPADAPFSALADEILAWEGSVYVHCAAGHARSAALVALALIRGGQVADLREAEALIKERRPRAGMNRGQRQLVRRLSHPPGRAIDATPL